MTFPACHLRILYNSNPTLFLQGCPVLAIMPGIPRSEFSCLDYPSEQDDPRVMHAPLLTASSTYPTAHQNSLHNNVRYIPSQMDVGGSPRLCLA